VSLRYDKRQKFGLQTWWHCVHNIQNINTLIYWACKKRFTAIIVAAPWHDSVFANVSHFNSSLVFDGKVGAD